MGQRKTTNYFIEKSIKIHGNKYDYSKVNYFDISTKVEIICPKHGSFWQTPNNHYNKKGCKKCHVDNKFLTNKQFIEKSVIIHKDLYDYSLVEYINIRSKVKIICKNHGVFEQVPNYHLSGNGCPIPMAWPYLRAQSSSTWSCARI